MVTSLRITSSIIEVLVLQSNDMTPNVATEILVIKFDHGRYEKFFH